MGRRRSPSRAGWRPSRGLFTGTDRGLEGPPQAAALFVDSLALLASPVCWPPRVFACPRRARGVAAPAPLSRASLHLHRPRGRGTTERRTGASGKRGRPATAALKPTPSRAKQQRGRRDRTGKAGKAPLPARRSLVACAASARQAEALPPSAAVSGRPAWQPRPPCVAREAAG